MTMFTFIHHFGPSGAAKFPSWRAGVSPFVARHRLTDEERKNRADYYRRNPVPSVAIVTASLGGHRSYLTGQQWH